MAIENFSNKAEVAALLKAAPLSPVVKSLIAGLLSFIDDRQFAEYSAIFSEIMGALSETARGQAVLKRLGLPYAASPDQRQ